MASYPSTLPNWDPDSGKAVDNLPFLTPLPLTEMDADELLYTSHFVCARQSCCLSLAGPAEAGGEYNQI